MFTTVLHFNIILSSNPQPPQWCLPFTFYNQTPVCTLHHILSTFWAYLIILASVWRAVHIVKLLINEFSPSLCYLRSLRSRCSQHLVFKLCSCLRGRDHVSHPHKTTGKIVVVCILTITFFDKKREYNAPNGVVENTFVLRSVPHVCMIWTVLWLRRLVAGFFPRKLGFNPRPIHVVFVLDQVDIVTGVSPVT